MKFRQHGSGNCLLSWRIRSNVKRQYFYCKEMKHSILWGGGGWYWEGEWAGLKWGGVARHVLSNALCLHFDGSIPECRLLISRLLWQCYSWQLAWVRHISPFQERQPWNLVACCQSGKLAPPFPWMAPNRCPLWKLLSYLLRDMKHLCNTTFDWNPSAER